jgi:lysyl-tRNA synthetase class 2
MSSIDEIRDIRIKKLELLKKAGLNPYPAHSNRELSLKEAIDDFDSLEKNGEQKWLAGRVMSLRGQGAIIFITLYDGTANFQGLLKKDVLGDEKFDLWNEVIDIGDFVEIRGKFFATKRGEKTLEMIDWNILSKSLRPLPEKWHGLQDVEERFRKRYLDILMNPEIKKIFEQKAKFWDVTRDFLKKENFMEVETPTLEITTGGAEARPFRTYHNDFDINVYMRISVGELWQKRLMTAGFPKTFEIGRVYRNEGSSPEHTQEFTNMEFYASYMNLDEGKKLVRDLYITIAWEVFGKTNFETRGHKFDLANDWKEIDYIEEVKRQTGIDVLEDEEKKMEETLKKLKVEFQGKNRERMTDSLWKYCRKNISGPAYLVNHPKLVAPLSKEHPIDNRKTEMFQVIIAGSEIGRAHAELNDPIDQKKRFDEQSKLMEEGDEEAMMPDDEFVEMLEYGMPPNFGFGFGERFFAFLIDKPLRETQLFPLMKPKDKLA